VSAAITRAPAEHNLVHEENVVMRVSFILLLFLASSFAFALPDESDFRVVESLPPSTAMTGCTLPDGRYLLWNGNTVFIQREAGSGIFDTVASGYIGDPSFAILSFDESYVLLGQGFGNGVTANVYPFDYDNPQDYQSGDEIVIQNHYWGAFLSPTLLALDRGDFGSPAEIVVINLSTARRSLPAPVTVLNRPVSTARDTIVTKPVGSFSASIVVDNGTLYVADAGNGQYKSFPVADIVNAYNISGTVAWSAGTDIGTPFQYPMNGVSGVTSGGDLVMSGFGSIAVVNPGSGNILDTYDPAGTGPFYGMVYNDVTEDFIAIAFPPTFGDPLTFYATEIDVASLPASSPLGIVALTLVTTAFAASTLRRRMRA